jgi:TPR repeat protein
MLLSDSSLSVPIVDIQAVRLPLHASSLFSSAILPLMLQTAMNSIAVVYDRGDEIQRDYAKSLALYRAAAKAGHSYAQYNLGISLHFTLHMQHRCDYD